MNFDDSFNNKEYLPYQSTVQFFLMFLFLWQSTFRVSDVGMNILFKFLSMLFKLLSKLLDIPVLIDFADYIPSNVLSGKKVLGTNVDNFDKFVCCPSCSALYNMEDCLETQLNGNTVSKLCPFIRFPLHPQK